MTEAELERMEKLEEAATKGPWEPSCGRNDYAVVTEAIPYPSEHQVRYGGFPIAECEFSSNTVNDANMDFICASREFVPQAIAELRRLRAEKPQSYSSVEEMLRAAQGDELADKVAVDIAKKNHANAVDAEKWRSGSLPWVKNVAGGEKPKDGEEVLAVMARPIYTGRHRIATHKGSSWYSRDMNCEWTDAAVTHWLRITPPPSGDGTNTNNEGNHNA